MFQSVRVQIELSMQILHLKERNVMKNVLSKFTSFLFVCMTCIMLAALQCHIKRFHLCTCHIKHSSDWGAHTMWESNECELSFSTSSPNDLNNAQREMLNTIHRNQVNEVKDECRSMVHFWTWKYLNMAPERTLKHSKSSSQFQPFCSSSLFVCAIELWNKEEKNPSQGKVHMLTYMKAVNGWLRREEAERERNWYEKKEAEKIIIKEAQVNVGWNFHENEKNVAEHTGWCDVYEDTGGEKKAWASSETEQEKSIKHSFTRLRESTGVRHIYEMMLRPFLFCCLTFFSDFVLSFSLSCFRETKAHCVAAIWEIVRWDGKPTAVSCMGL